MICDTSFVTPSQLPTILPLSWASLTQTLSLSCGTFSLRMIRDTRPLPRARLTVPKVIHIFRLLPMDLPNSVWTITSRGGVNLMEPALKDLNDPAL